jgi:endonuclease III
MKAEKFLRENSKPYSEILSIDLRDGDSEFFKWFLASILYSKPIREETASYTYRLFEKNGLTTPQLILKAGWDRLVGVLDEGGYTRYDFSTADRLIDICETLIKHYNGSLNFLYKESSGSIDLERRLEELGKGIGPVTISVFLRDMRLVWREADPAPTPKVRAAMKALRISNLKEYAKKEGMGLVELDTALHRYYNKYLRKKNI